MILLSFRHLRMQLFSIQEPVFQSCFPCILSLKQGQVSQVYQGDYRKIEQYHLG